MFDDNIDELLKCLCDCEGRYECEWHRRRRGFGTSGIVDLKELEDDMEWELARRHFFYIHGHEMDDEPDPEMQDYMPREEGDL